MIRKMKPTDIDNIMTVWLTANLEAHPFIDSKYWYQNASAVRNAILQAEVYCFVDNLDQVNGFIGLQGSYIAGLFVTKHYRSQHIGTTLLNIAKEKHHVLTLNVYMKNQAAINFYCHNGFNITKHSDIEAEMTWSKIK